MLHVVYDHARKCNITNTVDTIAARDRQGEGEDGIEAGLRQVGLVGVAQDALSGVGICVMVSLAFSEKRLDFSTKTIFIPSRQAASLPLFSASRLVDMRIISLALSNVGLMPEIDLWHASHARYPFGWSSRRSQGVFRPYLPQS